MKMLIELIQIQLIIEYSKNRKIIKQNKLNEKKNKDFSNHFFFFFFFFFFFLKHSVKAILFFSFSISSLTNIKH